MASKENQEALEEIKTAVSFEESMTWRSEYTHKCIDTLQKAIDRLEELENIKQISDVEQIATNEREMNAIEKISVI